MKTSMAAIAVATCWILALPAHGAAGIERLVTVGGLKANQANTDDGKTKTPEKPKKPPAPQTLRTHGSDLKANGALSAPKTKSEHVRSQAGKRLAQPR